MSSPLIITLAYCTVFVSTSLAGKGGNRAPATDIVNPDNEGPPKTLEYNEDEKFVEGDMIVPGDDKKGDRNAISRKSGKWIAGVVPYEFDENFSSSMQYKFEAAIGDFNKHTCVRWVKRLGERDYVYVNSNDDGCYAYLGRNGGKQKLNLQEGGWFTAGCGNKGTVIHEMLHTIGFAHEQSRNDRDNYITVHFDKITPKWHSQFRKLEKYQENNQGFDYDFSSVMHYSSGAFADGFFGGTTITTKDASKQHLIGQRAGFSKQDIEEVNKLYECESNKIQQPAHCKDDIYVGDCRNEVYKWGTGVCDRDHKKSIRSKCQNTCRVCRA